MCKEITCKVCGKKRSDCGVNEAAVLAAISEAERCNCPKNAQNIVPVMPAEIYCKEAKCNNCGKKTWADCGHGEHVDEVLNAIPPAERCECPKTGKSAQKFPIAPAVSPEEVQKIL